MLRRTRREPGPRAVAPAGQADDLEGYVVDFRLRQRMTEMVSFVVRIIGALWMVLLATLPSLHLPTLLPANRTVGTAVVLVPLCLAGSSLSWAALRTEDARRQRVYTRVQIAIDAALVALATVQVGDNNHEGVATLLVLPVLEAAARLGLVSALITCVLTVGAYPALTLADSWLRTDPLSAAELRSLASGCTMAATIGLVVAWMAGGQTRAIGRYLASLEQAAEVLRHQATHDALTGLGNRTLLYQTVAAAPPAAAVLVIDLDGFKEVNDTYGHATGDALLRETAARLLGCVGETDLVVRIGGDEFIVLLTDADGPRAEAVADDLRSTLAASVRVGEHTVSVGASVGVAVADGSTEWDLDALAAVADTRMYAAKVAGRRPQPATL